jgi:hypothetical protein
MSARPSETGAGGGWRAAGSCGTKRGGAGHIGGLNSTRASLGHRRYEAIRSAATFEVDVGICVLADDHVVVIADQHVIYEVADAPCKLGSN